MLSLPLDNGVIKSAQARKDMPNTPFSSHNREQGFS